MHGNSGGILEAVAGRAIGARVIGEKTRKRKCHKIGRQEERNKKPRKDVEKPLQGGMDSENRQGRTVAGSQNSRLEGGKTTYPSAHRF